MSHTNEQIIEKKNLLRELTKGMDIPSYHHESVNWLLKNLDAKNKDHKNYNKTIELCEELKRMGVQ